MNATIRKPTLQEKEELFCALNNLISQYNDYSCIQIKEDNNKFKCILIEYALIDSKYKVRSKVYLTEYYSNLLLLLLYHTVDYKKFTDKDMYKIMFSLKDWKEMLDELK